MERCEGQFRPFSSEEKKDTGKAQSDLTHWLKRDKKEEGDSDPELHGSGVSVIINRNRNRWE